MCVWTAGRVTLCICHPPHSSQLSIPSSPLSLSLSLSLPQRDAGPAQCSTKRIGHTSSQPVCIHWSLFFAATFERDDSYAESNSQPPTIHTHTLCVPQRRCDYLRGVNKPCRALPLCPLQYDNIPNNLLGNLQNQQLWKLIRQFCLAGWHIVREVH